MFDNHTWDALPKAWKGYVIAKNKQSMIKWSIMLLLFKRCKMSLINIIIALFCNSMNKIYLVVV
jgi:hypothetical protein